MALCHEFGVRICDDTCTVAMVAGSSACFCAHCGAICEGQFNGCAAVWASGRNGEGVEVDIRVSGPVDNAHCLSPRDLEPAESNGSKPASQTETTPASGLLGDVRTLVEHVDEMQRQVDRLVGGLGRGLSALAEQQKTIERRLAQLEAILRTGGTRSDPRAATSDESGAPIPAWADQMRQQLLELRASLASIIG